ncbi:hypothetical protein HSBGL_2955 [Halapricum desulfuricans]|uniref:Uncharacterized protein n=1 Tax=Halapricum desulfuricans TaxID=2841257 RepID=A0A897NR84_9EURY|nr:hypothetical protein HSBGL_2955 [Halapricum desulfuricans]
MLTHPQRFLGFDATLSALFGGAFGFNFHEVRAFPLTLRFEHIGERIPRCRRRVVAVTWRFQHPFHVEVFDRHQFVLPSVVVREFVQEITPLARTAVSSENRRFSGSRESKILERLLEGGGLAPAIS